MSDSSENDICRACGGKRSEHEGRVHVFADQDGQLETSEQKSKRLGSQNTPSPQPRQNLRETETTRLAEVMAHRGLIDDKDLLYVIGLGPQPWVERDQPTLFDGVQT